MDYQPLFGHPMRLLDHDIQAPPSDPETWESFEQACAGNVRTGLHGGVVDDRKAHEAIEKIYTAALLTRLWRDVRADVMEHDRLCIPADVAAKHGLDLALMRKALSLDTDRGCHGDAQDGSYNCANMPNSAMRAVLPAYREVMHDLVRRTRALFLEGYRDSHALPDHDRRLLRKLALEGWATLGMITRLRYDTLTRRPTLGVMSRVWLALRLRLRV